MIIEIAFGIVLAVVILRYLPLILAAGVLAVVVLAVLVVAGVLIYWAATSTEDFLILGSIVGGFVAIDLLMKYIAKKTILTEEESFGLTVVAAALAFAAYGVFEQYQKYGLEASALNPVVASLAVLGLAMLGAISWYRIRKRMRDGGTDSFFRKSGGYETGTRAISEQPAHNAELQTECDRMRTQRDENMQRYTETLGELRRRTGDYDWKPSLDRH